MLSHVINDVLNNIQVKYNTNNDIYYINNQINLLISNLYINNQIQYLTNNKGKNIRSLLSLYCYSKYRTNNSYSIDMLYKIMAIIELTHFASLLHDDVIDNSNNRRNEKSFNYLYGNKNSIIVGDYLLISNFKKLLNILHNKEYGQYIIKQFIKASSDTAYGAYLENKFNKEFEQYINTGQLHYNNIKQKLNNDIKQYIRIASLKTGSLFKLSCICGSILSNTSFYNVKQSAIFGTDFGIIYQIQNDLNDYKYNNCKESEDYMQDNITLPIIILNYITDIKQIFNNKTQGNFCKIKQLMNTVEFNKTLHNIVDKYINKLSY